MGHGRVPAPGRHVRRRGGPHLRIEPEHGHHPVARLHPHGVRRRLDHRLRPRAPGLVQPGRHAHEGHPAGIVGRRPHRRHRRPVPRQEGLRGEVLEGRVDLRAVGLQTRPARAQGQGRRRAHQGRNDGGRRPRARRVALRPPHDRVGRRHRRHVGRRRAHRPPRRDEAAARLRREAADARRGRRRRRLRGRAQRRHARAHLRPDARGFGEEVRAQEDRVPRRVGLRPPPEDATVSPEPLESCSLALWGARNTKRNPRRKQRTL